MCLVTKLFFVVLAQATVFRAGLASHAGAGARVLTKSREPEAGPGDDCRLTVVATSGLGKSPATNRSISRLLFPEAASKRLTQLPSVI